VTCVSAHPCGNSPDGRITWSVCSYVIFTAYCPYVRVLSCLNFSCLPCFFLFSLTPSRKFVMLLFIFSSTYIFFVIMMIQCCTDILRCIVPVCTQIILCVCTIVLGGFLSSQDLHTERNRERGTSPDSGKDPFYYIYTYCIYQASELFFFSFFLPFFIHMNVYIIPLAYFVFRLRVCVSYLNEEGRKHSACSSGSGLWKEPECVYILAVHRRFRQKCFFL